jgi:Domain of unknown function (DUF222)
MFCCRIGIEQVYDREVGAGGSIKELADALACLTVAPVAGEIEELLALRDRLDAKISEVLRAFDAERGFVDDGSVSLAPWLAAHGRRSWKEARREALTAKRLVRLPVTAAAWADGSLSSSQVGAVVANVSAERAGLYATHEAELTAVLAGLSVRDTADAMRCWRLRAEATEDSPEAPCHPCEFYLSETMEGRRELSGHLWLEEAAVVEAALAAATRNFEPGEGTLPSAAERRAAALVDVCRWFLDNSPSTSSASRTRPHVSVVVDLKELAGGGPGQLANGTPLPARTIEWLSCDSELHRLVMSGRSTVLDYGSSVRTISPAIWAALVVRDRHCRHPGCDRPPSWCDAHHIVHFSKGGPTRLDNLVLGCTRHHHLWHDQGWQLTLSRDGTLTLVSPKGLVLTSAPAAINLDVASLF